jgi:hypothetical protein
MNSISCCPPAIQTPCINVIEQGIIQSVSDLGKLRIIDWNRTNGYWGHNPVRAMRIIDQCFTGRTGYTVVKIDMQRFPERSDWPSWDHVGCHEQLGKLYWNTFHATFTGELKFSDAPDFEGTIHFPDYRDVTILGDIGEVSVSTFIMSMFQLNRSDLWISVPDAHTQIILEPIINLCDEWEREKAQIFSGRTEEGPPAKLTDVLTARNDC